MELEERSEVRVGMRGCSVWPNLRGARRGEASSRGHTLGSRQGAEGLTQGHRCPHSAEVIQPRGGTLLLPSAPSLWFTS